MVGIQKKTKFRKIEGEGRFGSLKTRRNKRMIYVKVPGGRTVIHFQRKKPAKARCGDCGTVLAGVANERPYKMRNLPKTMKRPERPYGGNLCSRCMRKKIIMGVRNV